MKTYILKTLALVLILCLLMTILAKIADEGLKKTEKDGFSVNKYINGGMEHNLLILGNSRAWVHFSPMILDSILHVNSYNMGEDAMETINIIGLYNLYIAYNSKPKYIVLSVYEDILQKQTSLPQASSYAPYLYNPIVWELVSKYNDFNEIHKIFPFIKHLRNESFIIGLEEYFGINHYLSSRYKGYEGRNIQWDGTFDKFKKDNPNGYYREYTEECFTALDEFIKQQLANGVNIALVWSPQYYELEELLQNKDVAVDFYKNLSDKYNIPFLDYSSDSICYNKDYFYNSQHMKKVGAELFSTKLATDLKNIGFAN
ncbi:hypothetical protein M2138_000162 [Dysgonomonadaceae bacterium PH5-43]|nr:hypothetical protein [Dysgonomonadaceae bacterium PH5-43]